MQQWRRGGLLLTNELYSTDAEQAIIANTLLNNDIYDDVSDDIYDDVSAIIKTPDYFYLISHRWIWKAITHLRNNGQQADIITVADYLESINQLQNAGGRSHISIVASIPAPGASLKHAEIVAAYYIRRRVRDLGGQIIGWAENNEKNPAMLVDLVQQQAYSLDYQQETDAVKIFSDPTSFIERLTSGQSQGEPTGYPDFDKYLAGFVPGKMYVIGADTSVGKTTLALNFMTHLAKQDKPSIIFSMEMDQSELEYRIAADLARVNSFSAKEGSLTPEECDRIAEKLGYLSQLPIKIVDKGIVTPARIRSQLRRLNPPAKLVVVDYVQLMHSGQKHENETTRISQCSQAIVDIARDFEVPILALSQLNRSDEARHKRRWPTLASLRGSGSLEQDAYAVIFIYREAAYYDKKEMAEAEEWKVRDTQIIIAKNRGGKTGVFDMTFFGEYNKFESGGARYGLVDQVQG